MAFEANRTRILLAWEGGAGRGHVVTLRDIAEALGADAICDAALCRMEHAAELVPYCDSVFQGARLSTNRARREAAGDPQVATWGDFLGDLNFWNPQFLIAQIKWWLETIKARKSRLVIADFAPCAQLAALISGIPSVAVGTGYSVPPAGLDGFPVLLPEYAELVFAEDELLRAVNMALVHYGVKPLTRLSDIYAGSTAMPRTIAGLDPYRSMRQAPPLPPLSEKLPRPDGSGNEIFFYFPGDETENHALVDALIGLDLPMRAFIPGATAGVRELFAEAGVTVEARPVSFEAINRRSRLLLHSGQHGTLCMGLGMGIGQVAFPQHLEHLFHARRAGEMAPVRIVDPAAADADEISATIMEAYEIGGGDAAATEKLRASLFGDAGAMARARILPLLQQA
ncbi:hypothetical protein [Devosia sp.]|uniref:hypothetical protein n=1 Tax=Devosia sp. TaxID=1871048 RepID=UPI001B152535|nr:hypothetical protein [Devosia sp.]MBO9589339.1 hypothetical protein [Devosia sp.]